MRRFRYLLTVLILFGSTALQADAYRDSIRHVSDSLTRLRSSDTITEIGMLRAYEALSKHLMSAGYEYFDTCREVCEDAIAYAHRVHSALFESSFNTRIGTTYYYEGEYGKVSYYWTRALEVSENAHDTVFAAQALNNLGILNLFIQLYDESLDYFSQSVKLKKQLHESPLRIAVTELNMAVVLNRLNKNDSALTILQRIYPVIDTSNNTRAMVTLYNCMGTVYSGLGQYSKAMQEYTAAEKLKNALSLHDRIVLKYNIGETMILMGRKSEGIKRVRESLDQAKKNNDLYALRGIYRILSNYYKNLGNFEKGYDYTVLYGKYRDSLFNIEKNREIRKMQTIYELDKKEQENKLLAEKVKNEEFKTLRHKRLNLYLLIIFAVVFAGGLIITFFWNKLRSINSQLLRQKSQLEKLNQDLIVSKDQTEKALEFKSQFLANMSHEIRTPLNIIIGFNSILKKYISDSKLRKYIHSIEVSSYNLLQFLNDILDMSKIEAGKMQLKPENINLKRMIYDLREVFALKAAEKNIALEVEIDPKLPKELFIDEIRLRQILVNLIGNAIKFTNEGFVKITANAGYHERPFGQHQSTTRLEITVKDTGIGIEKDHQKEVFDSFRQINNKQQKQLGGSGLGLSISKRLVELMGGTLSLESEPGDGSSFTITFDNVPVGFASKKDDTGPMDLSQMSNIEFEACTILVADDEEMNRSLIKACFEKSKVTVVEASDGQEAFDKARETHPDLVLMDLKMPFVDGFEAARMLKADNQLKNIPVFAFTASNLYSDLSEEELGLFSSFIAKPVYVNELYEEMARFLNHHFKGRESKKNLGQVLIEEKIAIDRRHLSSGAAEYLNQTIKKRWDEVAQSNSMNRIREFAEDLNNFGRTNNISSLQLFASELIDAVKSFDIDKANSLLRQYPEIVHSLTVITSE